MKKRKFSFMGYAEPHILYIECFLQYNVKKNQYKEEI